MHSLRYVICDVFTETALAGNALCVFTNPGPLSDVAMQSLAREMNLSETVFVERAREGGHARIRIFTPSRELPFAGHPILGTAVVLGQPMQLAEIRLETRAGIIPVQLAREGARVSFGWMQQPLPKIVPFAQTEALFAALGVAGSVLPVELYDLGPRHVFVALETKQEVATLAPDLGALARVCEAGVSVFSCAGASWKTRMFAPGLGVNEDPATGSAAGPLAFHLARYGRIGFGDEITIEQGIEVGRPSTLYARAHGDATAATRIDVGGTAVVVAHGEFRLRPELLATGRGSA